MSGRSTVMNRGYLPWPPPLPPSAGRLRLPATENPQKILASQRHKFTPASLSRRDWKPKKPYKVHAAETADFQQANRYKKARRFFQKKRQRERPESCDFAPFTPHNTTSFLIRAKRSGGIASLVSPYPVTPSVLPTPKFSPSREVLAEVAKEEWGVDGYGSMNGLIRLRSPENGAEETDEGEGVIDSCESDVEEVEKRLSHDLNRFEMIYAPNYGNGGCLNQNRILQYNVDGKDEHIERLEEENIVLKERIYTMEKEIWELRRRMRCFGAEDENCESENEIGVNGGGGGGGGGSEGSVGDCAVG